MRGEEYGREGTLAVCEIVKNTIARDGRGHLKKESYTHIERAVISIPERLS